MLENKKAKHYTEVIQSVLRSKYKINIPQSVIHAVLKIALRNIHIYMYCNKVDIRLQGYLILYYPKDNRDRYLKHKRESQINANDHKQL